MRSLLPRRRPRQQGRVILRRVYDAPHIRLRPHLVMTRRQEPGDAVDGPKPVA